MKKSQVVILLVVAVAAFVAVYLLVGNDAPSPVPAVEMPHPETPSPSVAPSVPVVATNAAPVKVRKPVENGWAEALGSNRLAAAAALLKRQKPEREPTEAEQALVTSAHEIAAAEDVAKARAFAAKHFAAEHPKVREAVVFALANCGTSCLAELTPFMADPDEGVRIEAQSAWQNELSQLKDPQLKVDAIVAVMCVLNDEQVLEPIVQQLVGMDRLVLAEVVKVVAANGTEAGKNQVVRLAEAHGDRAD